MNQLRGFYGAGPIFTRSRECSSCAWRDGDLCACRPVQKFIQDQGFYICQDVFYQRFVAWCKKKERGVETKTRVTRLLGTMGHHSTQKRPHGKQEWVYTGMRWMDESRARCGVPPDRPETPLTSNSP